MSAPTITTTRLLLQAATAEDLPALMALESHPDNSDFIWQGTREQHLAEIDDPDTELLVVRRHGEDKVIGYVLSAIQRHSHHYELRRIAIGPKDGGLGAEVIRALMVHAFTELGTNRFWLDVYPHNPRGIHLYEKLGMHRDGVLRENYLAADGYRDQIVYSVLRREFDEMVASGALA